VAQRVTRFRNMVEKTNLKEALQAIHSSEDYVLAFKFDFLGHSLSLYGISKPLEDYEYPLVLRWLNLHLEELKQDPRSIYGCFALITVRHKRSLDYLLWLLEGSREVDKHLLKERGLHELSFLKGVRSVTELEAKCLQHLFVIMESLWQGLARGTSKQKADDASAFRTILLTTFRKFPSFASLWERLLEPQVRIFSVDQQSLVIFFASLYLLLNETPIEDANLDWAGLGVIRQRAHTAFKANAHPRGFSALLQPLNIIWTGFKPLVSAEQAPRLLFSLLDFFLFTDMTLTCRSSPVLSPQQAKLREARMGACHIPSTFPEDVELLLELLDEKDSRASPLGASGLLPAFLVPHKILELLEAADKPSRKIVETVLGRMLTRPDMGKRLDAFVAPQFAPPDRPVERGFIFALFQVYLTLELRLETKQPPTIAGNKKPDSLRRFMDLVRAVALCQKTAALISALKNVDEGIGKLELRAVQEILRGDIEKQAYLVQAIKPQEKIDETLRSSNAIKSLGLDLIFLIRDAQLAATKYYMFPFAVDEAHPDHKFYLELEIQVKTVSVDTLVDMIKARCQRNPKGYLEVRLYLATIAYYSFYNVNSGDKCPAIKSLLARPDMKTLLELDDGMIKAYNLFCDGGVHGNAGDDLIWFFSNESRDKDPRLDMTMRHIMANVLIFTLACPPGSNHFHTRIFAPEVLGTSHVRGPGSTFPNEQDCGYYLSDNGQFEDRENLVILGGSRVYRLAFNMVTWMAMCLALLVDPQRNHRHISQVCYHGEFRKFDVVLQKMDHFSDDIALKKYVMQRPGMFYTYLGLEQTLLDSNLEPSFFVTQVLYHIWKDLIATKGTPEGEVYRGKYQKEPQTKEYEERIKVHGFDPVMKNFQNLRGPYESFLKKEEGLALALQRRDRLSAFQARTLRVLDQGTFVEIFAALRDASENYPNLTKFKDFKKYCSIKYLPFLIKVYNWIHKHLSGEVTMDEARELTFQNVVARLKSDRDRKKGETFVVRLPKIWNQIVANNPNYQVCAAAERAGEGKIPKFDDNMKFSGLIALDFESTSYDHLLRLIRDLCTSQQTLAPPGARKYDAQLLHDSFNSLSLLLNIDDAEDPLAWVKYFAHPTASGTTFDWRGIDDRVRLKFLQGLADLNQDALKQTFVFRGQKSTADLTSMMRPQKKGPLAAGAAGEEGNDQDSVMATASLKHLAGELSENYRKPVAAEDLKKWQHIVRCSEENYIALIQALTFTCRQLALEAGSPQAPKGGVLLQEYAKSKAIFLPPVPDDVVRKLRLPLAQLHQFASFVVRSFSKKDFLFSDLEASLNTEALPKDLRDNLFPPLVSVPDDLMQNLGALQQIAELLLSPPNKAVLARSTQTPICMALERGLAALHLPAARLASLLPHTVLALHCGSYLREVYQTCGSIQYKLLSTPRDGVLYVEKVPELLAAQQLRLENSDAFQPDTEMKVDEPVTQAGEMVEVEEQVEGIMEASEGAGEETTLEFNPFSALPFFDDNTLAFAMPDFRPLDSPIDSPSKRFRSE